MKFVRRLTNEENIKECASVMCKQLKHFFGSPFRPSRCNYLWSDNVFSLYMKKAVDEQGNGDLNQSRYNPISMSFYAAFLFFRLKCSGT